MAHADSKMSSELARDLAYHLSWEFFLTDHNIEVQRALGSIFPGGVPDLSSGGPANVAEQMAGEVYKLWHKLWEKSFAQRRFDTVAVGIVSGRKEILVAANLTKHAMKVEPPKTGGQGPVVNLKGKDIFRNQFKVSELGLHDGRHEDNIRNIAGAFPQLRGTTITILVPENRPTVPDKVSFTQNRFPHAEMQIFKYAKDKNLSIEVVGISKMACLNCREVLKEHNIKYSYAWYGNLDFKRDIGPPKAFPNWGDPRRPVDLQGRSFPGVRVQARINIERLSDAGIVQCDCTTNGTDCDGCQGKVLGQNNPSVKG